MEALNTCLKEALFPSWILSGQLINSRAVTLAIDLKTRLLLSASRLVRLKSYDCIFT